MKRKLLNSILVPLLILLPAVGYMGSAYACGNTAGAQAVSEGIAQTGGTCDDSGVTNAIKLIVNVLSLVVGTVAIIVIIVSGLKYITSGGDAGKVGNAKNTLIYALIGVALAALAQVLVHFVLYQTNTAVGPCPSNPSIAQTDSACH